MADPTAPPPEVEPTRGLLQSLGRSKLVRVVLRYPDFRLLWFGAFFSFTGSWVQNVAQGWYVNDRWNDEKLLSLVSFAWSIPVFLFGLFAGALSDVVDKRVALVVTHILYALSALYLAAATYFGFVEYWHIALIALLNGTIASIEMPVRQSTVSNVVPIEDLPSAVPINAMTFNVARILGPAIGGALLAAFGVPACYLANGISYLALIWAALAIKADLRAPKRAKQPVMDLVTEGMLYTFRDRRLRTLFILETITGVFGLAYLPLLPAYVTEHLRLESNSERALANAYIGVGIGALIGLLLIVQYSDERFRAPTIRFAMWGIGIGLLLLSVIRVPWMVYSILGFVGMCTIWQFNTTNALFQLLSPERIRGRVLAMHIWSLNGLSPIGVLFGGWIAYESRKNGHLPLFGLDLATFSVGPALAMQVGGAVTLLGAVAATLSRQGLSNLEPAR